MTTTLLCSRFQHWLWMLLCLSKLFKVFAIFCNALYHYPADFRPSFLVANKFSKVDGVQATVAASGAIELLL